VFQDYLNLSRVPHIFGAFVSWHTHRLIITKTTAAAAATCCYAILCCMLEYSSISFLQHGRNLDETSCINNEHNSKALNITSTGWSKKWHKVYGTIILQPYITESCGFQQNVLEEILHITKVSV